MGYFSNGSEGDYYRAKFCDKCVHDDEQAGRCCTVWTLHLGWNYDAVGTDANRVKAEALNMFIPRTRDGGNGDCTMFEPKPPDDDRILTIDERFPDSVHPAYRRPAKGDAP